MLELVFVDVGTDLELMSQHDQLNCLLSCNHLIYYLIYLQTVDFATPLKCSEYSCIVLYFTGLIKTQIHVAGLISVPHINGEGTSSLHHISSL